MSESAIHVQGISPYIEIVSINLPQIYCSRVRPWAFIVDIANSMRSQIDLAILVIGDFIFPGVFVSLISSLGFLDSMPLIESHIVLNEQDHLIWQIQWPQRSCEVDVFEKHPAGPCTAMFEEAV